MSGLPKDARYHIFTVDHIPSEPQNWNYFDYLQIAHLECNIADRGRKVARGESVLRSLEREKTAATQLHAQTEPVEVARQEKVPLVIAINYDHETKFRYYMLNRHLVRKQNEILDPRGLRIQAAEYSGSGRASSYFYSERLYAENGPLMKDYDKYAKVWFSRFRDPRDSQLTVEQLMEKYPKTGRTESGMNH